MVRHGQLGQPKLVERRKAIALRHQGLSYNEILKRVPVAKSTLSVWLGSVHLSKKQEQRLTAKKRTAQLKGGATRHAQRVALVHKIHTASAHEIKTLSKRELWLLGIALYWAEGTKEKEHRSGSGVQFANSDVLMIQLFLLWLTNVCHVPPEDISLVLYIHVNQDNRIGKIKEFWFKNTGYRLKSVYFKKHTIKTVRKNTGDTYQGTAVINVKKSSTLNRQIAGWVQGIVKNVPTS